MSSRGYNRRRRRSAGILALLALLLGAGAAGYYAMERPNVSGLVSGLSARAGQTAPPTTAGATSVPTARAQVGLPTARPTVAGMAAAPRSTTAPAATRPRPTTASKPRRTAVPKPTKAAATPTPSPTVVPKPGPARRTYTVAAGDTLYGIAQETGVPLEVLARANGLDTQSEVYVGQQLLVPTRTAPLGIQLPAPREKLEPPRVRPLAEYSPELVRYLDEREGASSAAIYVPKTDTLYTHNPERRFLMASTIKVPIMLTLLSRQYARDQEATNPGNARITPMIIVSDNSAADQLFPLAGRKRGIEAELRARGLTETAIAPRRWGTSTTTAQDMALLMRSLYYGERLNTSLRRTAIGLMGNVVEEQRWGVPEGLGKSGYVAFKGGWLPTPDGWQVHQIGVAEVNGQNLVFSLYNSNQPGEVYGRETLEGAARIIARQGPAR